MERKTLISSNSQSSGDMKSKLAFSILFILGLAVTSQGQAPLLVNYQGVARNASGNVLSEQSVGLKVAIRHLNVGGSVVFEETHSVVTNPLGLFSVHIGNGQAVVGDFEDVDWGAGPFFAEIALDPNGNGDYSIVGTQQIVSVPYALNSRSLTLQSPDGTWWDLSVDNSGMFNTTLICNPPVSDANAGADQLNLMGASTNLSANIPSIGQGEWSILSGNGGSIQNSGSPVSLFTGNAGETYVLRWSITNQCGQSYDDVIISFSSFQLPSCNCQGQTLYVFPSDNSTNIRYHNVSSLIGPQAQSPNDGRQNTNAIIAAYGADLPYAAQLCYNVNAYGYNDWYLPSKDELNCLYLNRSELGDNFNTTATTGSGGGCATPTSWYWSSTEYSDSEAWRQIFSNSTQNYINKWYTCTNSPRVRCVRRD
jgi:hypothetical protein